MVKATPRTVSPSNDDTQQPVCDPSQIPLMAPEFMSPSFSQSIQSATEFLKHLQHQQIDQQLLQIQEYQSKVKQQGEQPKSNGVLAQLASKDFRRSINSPNTSIGSMDMHNISMEGSPMPALDFEAAVKLERSFSDDDKILTHMELYDELNARRRSHSTPMKPRTGILTKPKLTKSKSAGSMKRKTCNRWTKAENEKLKEAIATLGEKKWNDIAQFVGTKNSDQCNQHWHRVINPKISKKPWSEEEDDILIDRVFDYGESSWKRVAEGLSGRTDIQCRHRYIMLKKYEKQGKGRPIVRRPKPEAPPGQEIPSPNPHVIIYTLDEGTLIQRRQFPNMSLELEDCNMSGATQYPTRMYDINIQQDGGINFISPSSFSINLTQGESDHTGDHNMRALQEFGQEPKETHPDIKVEEQEEQYHHEATEWAQMDCYDTILAEKRNTTSLPEFGTFGSDYTSGSNSGVSVLDRAMSQWGDFTSESSACSAIARTRHPSLPDVLNASAFENTIESAMDENADWMHT